MAAERGKGSSVKLKVSPPTMGRSLCAVTNEYSGLDGLTLHNRPSTGTVVAVVVVIAAPHTATATTSGDNITLESYTISYQVPQKACGAAVEDGK